MTDSSHPNCDALGQWLTARQHGSVEDTTDRASETVVVFDAMGVLYDHPDDVADVLVPFVVASGGTTDVELIAHVYLEQSLGKLDEGAFWSMLDVDGEHADDLYCRNHRLVPGVLATLRSLHGSGVRLGCLSNDVSEWSLALRRRFALDRYIETWGVSGDVGCRKPDHEIYGVVLERMVVRPDQVPFVDYRAKNVASAQALGMRSIAFGRDFDAREGLVPVTGMAELGKLLQDLLRS